MQDFTPRSVRLCLIVEGEWETAFGVIWLFPSTLAIRAWQIQKYKWAELSWRAADQAPGRWDASRLLCWLFLEAGQGISLTEAMGAALSWTMGMGHIQQYCSRGTQNLWQCHFQNWGVWWKYCSLTVGQWEWFKWVQGCPGMYSLGDISFFRLKLSGYPGSWRTEGVEGSSGISRQ